MKRRILIVHDRDDELARIVKRLPPQRFSVTCAHSAEEALEQLGADHPAFDLALINQVLDVHSGGARAERRTRRHDRRRNTAVELMTTAHGRSAATDVLLVTSPRPNGPQVIVRADVPSPSRPFTPEDLAAILRDRSRRRSELDAETSNGLGRLLQIAADVSSSLELNDVLKVACRAATNLLRVSHAAVVLLSSDSSSGTVLAEYPLLGFKGLHVPVLDVPAAKCVVETGKVLEVQHSAISHQIGPVARWAGIERVSSMLVAPIAVRNRVLGFFAFSSVGRSRRRRAEEHKLCEGLAALVGVAVENARLYHESRTRADQLEQIRRTALALTAHVDREERLKRIIRGAVELVRATGGGVYSYDQSSGTLKVIADHQRPQHFNKTVRVGQGMAGDLVQTQKPFLAVPDYRLYPNRAVEVFDEHAFGSVLEVLLTWEGQIVGVLYVDDSVGREFSDKDIRTLCIYAEQAAVALATTTPPEQWIERLRATSEILDNLGVTELDQRLMLIAVNAAKLIDAETAGVFLVKEPGVLSLEASHGHREGMFQKGKRLPIRANGGLTGHIAFEGLPFRAHGDALIKHPAVLNPAPPHLPSGRCYSLVALPLFTGQGDERTLKALLRLENKRGPDGRPSADIGFSESDERSLQVFGEAVVIAITNAELVAELRKKQQVADRRRELLSALHAAVGRLQPERDITELRHEVIRAAVDLLGGVAGCLYVNHPRVQKIEVVATVELDPEYVVGTTERHSDVSIASAVAREGVAQIVTAAELGTEFGGRSFQTLLAVPLGRGPGSMDGVIVVAGNSSHHQFAEMECEVLEQFGAHVAGLFQTANVRSWPTTAFEQVESLRQLMTYMTTAGSEEKVLAALVTGATAGYGLGFNRAAAFLVNDGAKCLDGTLGVGDIDEAKARQGWIQKDDLAGVDRYLQYLDSVGHYKTELDERIRGLCLPLDCIETSPVLRTVRTQGYVVIDSMEQLQQLPPELMDAMDADTACIPRPMAIVPLTISGTLLGFVVADSLFKKEDISHETIQTFLTLSQTAATALSRLRGDRTSSGSVGVALGPIVIRQFLRTAIESTKAASAVLWCYDSHRGWRLAEWVGVGIEHWNEFQRHLPEPGYTTYTALNKTWLSVENLDDPTPAPFIRSETRNLLHQIGVRAFQAVAVTLGMELLGVLYLNYTESRPFGSEDRDLAIALATSAALTLKNAETDTRRTQTAEQLQATLGIASLGVLVSEWEHLVGKNVHLLRDYMRDVGTVLDRLLRPPIGVDLSQNVVAVDVNEILRDLEIQEKKTWDEADYSLEISPANGPVIVRGNPVWLKHAFLHFVANAKKALDRRNDTSRPGHLTVTVASDATRAFVEFTDTGDGIDPEVRPRVFSEQIVDPNPTGFGIGLRTARTILLAYGGDASVGESTGNGTCMCVWLPLHQQGVSVTT